MYNIKYVLLDYIRDNYSVFNMLVGSRGDLGCNMAQVPVIMFWTVIIIIIISAVPVVTHTYLKYSCVTPKKLLQPILTMYWLKKFLGCYEA